MRRSDDAQILPRPAIFAKPALITALAAWSVLAPTNAFADACAQPPASLVSWWSGDGHFYDLAGANHASSLTEVRFATGKVGLAGRFQGPGLGHCTRLPRLRFGTNDLTIEAWIKAPHAPAMTSSN